MSTLYLVGVREALRQLFRVMSPARRRQFYAVLGLMIAGAFAELVAIGTVLPFLSLLADPGKLNELPIVASLFSALGAETQAELMITATLVFGAAVLVAGALRLQLAWSSQGFVFSLGHDIAVEVQRRILSQPYSYHISNNTSEIVASLEKVQILAYNVLLQVMQAAIAAVIALFIIIALVQVDPTTALLSAAAFALMYTAVSAFTRGRLAQNSAVNAAAYNQRVQMIQESLGGIRDIIIDKSQDVYLQMFERVDARFTRAKAMTNFIAAAPRFVIEAGGMILLAVLALVMAEREQGLAGALPVLGALALGAQRLLPLIQQIYYGWTALAGNQHVMGDVLRLLQLPEHDLGGVDRRVEPLSFERDIRLENVSLVYPGRAEPALDAINLVIPRGSQVALIGQTGSGKSTLADLLMGLLEPSSGRLAVDGVALIGRERSAWQRSIAHVPQAIFLADTSIERNIAFGCRDEEIDRDRVVSAARRAQLHDVIEQLPEGYATSVGERGVRLSGGQRQRLGIARALYKRAPVLVLDEATSALDDAVEATIIDNLRELGGEGMTIIMIAHRLSTIVDSDLVVRLESGRIAEVGSFSAVVGTKQVTSLAS